MNEGTRVEIVETDYDVDQSPELANGQQGVIVERYQTGLCIVKMDNCTDYERDGWSFYPEQLKEIK